MLIELDVLSCAYPKQYEGRLLVALNSTNVTHATLVEPDGTSHAPVEERPFDLVFEIPLKTGSDNPDRYHAVSIHKDVYFGDIPVHRWIQVGAVDDGWIVSFGLYGVSGQSMSVAVTL